MLAQDNILETRDLRKDFAGFCAVDGVSLQIKRGSIHALIGPNGAGKTTCFNLITKFLRPTAGSIWFDGAEVTGLGPARVARQGLVRSFQISAIFPHLTALENVRMALQRKSGGSFAFWRPKTDLLHLHPHATELLDSVGLAHSAHMLAGDLPYGRKRALEIATTLALEPQLLLLDEPTAGMAHEDIGKICDVIRRSAKDRTVLMVEHNLRVVADLSDCITVLARGKVIAEGRYEAIAQDAIVREAYLGHKRAS